MNIKSLFFYFSLMLVGINSYAVTEEERESLLHPSSSYSEIYNKLRSLDRWSKDYNLHFNEVQCFLESSLSDEEKCLVKKRGIFLFKNHRHLMVGENYKIVEEQANEAGKLRTYPQLLRYDDRVGPYYWACRDGNILPLEFSRDPAVLDIDDQTLDLIVKIFNLLKSRGYHEAFGITISERSSLPLVEGYSVKETTNEKETCRELVSTSEIGRDVAITAVPAISSMDADGGVCVYCSETDEKGRCVYQSFH